ncbi:nuclear transport factor 2 family protein [Balneola sp. MJW-20]|uniref:nuclear transport factor 2 family protein n=1 Tax=Gracilimonas aurantiaca TaxID=3234185 RepID=UPI003466EE98
MKKLILPFLMALLFSSGIYAQNETSTKKVWAENIRQLLDDFLYGASIDDPRAHDRFWAEDLIYTSSSGTRRGKKEIMAGYTEDHKVSEKPAVLYTSEDVEVRFYGNTAVLTFTLVATPQNDPDAPKSFYYNSGVLVRRGAQWKVINWQATAIPVNVQ